MPYLRLIQSATTFKLTLLAPMTPTSIIKVVSMPPQIKIEVWAIIPMQIITVSVESAVVLLLSIKPTIESVPIMFLVAITVML